MDNIPERAAWLDHPISWIGDISMFEVDRLDIGEVILLDGQVSISINQGRDIVEIAVNEVEVVSIDEMSGQLVYRNVGQKRFTQSWDVGGVNLTSASQRTQTIF